MSRFAAVASASRTLSRVRSGSQGGGAAVDPYKNYTTFYASASAGGGGNGTLGNPWTMAQAFANLTAGQRVLFRGGTYSLGGGAFDTPAIQPSNNGSSTSAYIVFQNYPNETPTFRIDSGKGGAFGSRGDFHVFRGLTVLGNHANVNVGTMAYGATRCRFEHLTISGITNDGSGGDANSGCIRIREGGSTGDIYVEHCSFDGPTATGNNQFNIEVYSTNLVTIRYCYGTGSSGGLVNFKGSETISYGMPNATVYRNHSDGNEHFVKMLSLATNADNRQITENLAYCLEHCFPTNDMQLQGGTSATNQKINRNTLVTENGSGGNIAGILDLRMNSSAQGLWGTGMQMTRNIFAKRQAGDAFIYVVNSGSGTGQLPTDADIDENIYHNNVSFLNSENGSSFNSLAAWQSGASVSGTDANSLYQDAGFNDFNGNDFEGPTQYGAFSNGFVLDDVGPNPYTEIV